MMSMVPIVKRLEAQILTVIALGLLPFILILVALGFSFKSSALIVLSLLIQILGGGTLWLLASRDRSIHIAEVLGVGLALGSISATLCAQALLPLEAGVFGFQLPGLFALIIWAISPLRLRLTHTLLALQPRGSFYSLFIYGVSLSSLALLSFFRVNPEVKHGVTQYQLDLPYFEALSQGVTSLGNSENVIFAHTPLRYHWFAYAWSGWETKFSSAEQFLVLTRLLPLVSTLGIILLTIVLVQMLSRRTLPSALALTIGVFGSAIAGRGPLGSVIYPISPSQFITTIWLMAASVVYLRFVKSETESIYSSISFAILCVGCVGGKFSTIPILGGAIFTVTTLLILRKQNLSRAIASLAIYLVTTLSAYSLIIAGHEGQDINLGLGMGVLFDLSVKQKSDYSSGISWVLVGVAGIISLAAKTFGVLLAIRSSHKLTPEVLFACGGLLAGITLCTLIDANGLNQLFFIYAGLILATPVAAVGLFEGFRITTPKDYRVIIILLLIGVSCACFYYVARFEFLGFNIASIFRVSRLTFWIWAPIVTLLIVILLASIVAIGISHPRQQLTQKIFFFCAVILTSVSVSTGVIWSLGGQLLQPFVGRVVDKPIGYSSGWGWTSSHQTAMTWLKAETSLDDVVATNRFCASREPVNSCFAGSYFVSALSGRRMLIEGHYWTPNYQQSTRPAFFQDRINASLAFSKNPTDSTWQRLRSYGVTWVVIDKEFPKAKKWEPFGVKKFENQHVILIHLVSSDASAEIP